FDKIKNTAKKIGAITGKEYVDGFKKIPSQIKNFADTSLASIKSLPGSINKSFKEIKSKTARTFSELGKNVVSTMKSSPNAIKGIPGTIQGSFGKVKSSISDTFEKGKDKVGSFKKSLGNLSISSIAGKFKELGSTIKNTASTGVSSIKELSNSFEGVGKNTEGLQKKLGENKKSLFDLSAGAGALGGVLAGATAGGIVAVAGATTAFGLAVMDVSGQAMQAQREFQGELGVTEERAKQLSDVAVDVFANNFGDSVLGVKNTIVEVQNQLRLVDDTAIQEATENAYRLSDAFGIDTTESLDAVKSLMENFGLTSDEAFSMVANGFQAGLNSSDDFL
ncbi:MAG TPA: hypothetical protein V6C96_00130, partial [Vampirovibrionales bacterium]